jgi:hypothetical protein
MEWVNKIFDPTAKLGQMQRTFRLIEGNDGGVCVVLVDANGTRLPAGYILKITGEGKLKLIAGVNRQCGLQINEETSKIEMEE